SLKSTINEPELLQLTWLRYSPFPRVNFRSGTLRRYCRGRRSFGCWRSVSSEDGVSDEEFRHTRRARADGRHVGSLSLPRRALRFRHVHTRLSVPAVA